MKHVKFIAACVSIGSFAGVVSGRAEIGGFAALGLYTLLLSLDAIWNSPDREEQRRPSVPADCAGEL
jgi:hypothetical protein